MCSAQKYRETVEGSGGLESLGSCFSVVVPSDTAIPGDCAGGDPEPGISSEPTRATVSWADRPCAVTGLQGT